ncbi:hypothetical protein [Cytobacillus purgationiresistens]|uniref:Lipoprotein n=1 Tax=Cytobacillus purgationiresistens TaxID=863449 RepID=A0ABU0AHE3_9BACI|nr:hypothetical protein [Cytobacillus purgationiresistens]MDQ0270685.1 hypothetical protein [Cytobacillus purgationiresistens]
MKNPLKLLLMSVLFMFVLAGCGTSQNDDGASSSQPPKEEEANHDDHQNEEEHNDDGKIRLLEQNIEYDLNGETKEDTAFLIESDNQDYSMYVLPDFALTGEEPNQDVLHLKKEAHIFMRIELLPEDIDWAKVEENTKVQLESVNKEITTPELPKYPFYQDATVMEASDDGDTVTSLLIKNEQTQVKLTIFTDENEKDYKDAFIKMAQTIESK